MHTNKDQRHMAEGFGHAGVYRGTVEVTAHSPPLLAQDIDQNFQEQKQAATVEYTVPQTAEHVESGTQQPLKGTVSKTTTSKKNPCLKICMMVSAALLVLGLIWFANMII